MQKPYSREFFGHKICISELIFFKISAALFKTFGMQKDESFQISFGVSKKCDFGKGSYWMVYGQQAFI